MHPIETIRDADHFRSVIAGEVPVLVDLWAPWCGPCRMIAPALEEIARELDGRVRIAKLNVDEHPDLANELGVQGIPTLVVFAAGKETGRTVGAAPKARLREWLLELAA